MTKAAAKRDVGQEILEGPASTQEGGSRARYHGALGGAHPRKDRPVPGKVRRAAWRVRTDAPGVGARPPRALGRCTHFANGGGEEPGRIVGSRLTDRLGSRQSSLAAFGNWTVRGRRRRSPPPTRAPGALSHKTWRPVRQFVRQSRASMALQTTSSKSCRSSIVWESAWPTSSNK